MINRIKKKIAQIFPSIGKIKRFIIAFLHSNSNIKHSYSQHKEDQIIYNLLKCYDLKGAIYIDVGANHPTSISNTYLFYRLGYKGICIEPNKELVKLHKIFRKNDLIISVGCGDKSGIYPFYHSKVPVLSSFKFDTFKNSAIQSEKNFWYKEYLPVLKLDDITENIDLSYNFIFFLSVDVEGLDFNVLVGSEKTLKNTLVVCVEYNDEDSKKNIIDFMIQRGFEIYNQISCNIIFKNKSSFFDKFLI